MKRSPVLAAFLVKGADGSGFLLKKGLSSSLHFVLGFPADATCAGGWLEKIAKIRSFLFDDPVGGGFPAFIVIGPIIKIAIFAGVRVPSAMGAGILPVIVVCLYVLSARPAGSHDLLQWHHAELCFPRFLDCNEH